MDLNALRRRAGLPVVLQEATDYRQMFNPILKKYPQDAPKVEQEIAWAKQVLRKNDRIVWYLRWAYMEMLAEVDPAQAQAARNRYVQRFHVEAPSVPHMRYYKQKLEHFMSLQSPEVQSIVFGAESPDDMLEKLTSAEEVWQARIGDQERLLQPHDDDEKLIEFPDGFAWWHLPRGSCDEEGSAMGHCGNSAAVKNGETILSLRRKVIMDDQSVMWYPVATFIRDSYGWLGEMKGRANKKPIERYHPYIVALLNHDIIEGIKGGGYAADQNFSLRDLDDKVRNEILKNKPSLGGISHLINTGNIERIEELITNKLSARNIRIDTFEPLPGGKDIVIEKWPNFSRFVDGYGSRALEGLVTLIEDGEIDGVEISPPVDSDARIRVIEMLPDKYTRALLDHYRISEKRVYAVAPAILHHMAVTRDEFWEALETSFHHGIDPANLQYEAKKRLCEYLEAGIPFSSPGWLIIGGAHEQKLTADNINLDAEVLGVVSLSDLAEIADTEYGDDNDYYSYDIEQHGWFSNPNDHFEERMGKHGEGLLADDQENDGWLATISLSDSNLRVVAQSFIQIAFYGMGAERDTRTGDLFPENPG